MPRPRRKIALPHGIKPDALPAYVYYSPLGRGRWLYRYRDPDTGKLLAKRIASGKATLREIWAAYDAVTAPPACDSLITLISRFSDSSEYAELAAKTRADYDYCARSICAVPTRYGALIGTTKLTDWTPGQVRAYVDLRAKNSRSRANHELRYLRRLFSWAFERDIMPTNPAKGVKALKEAPRQRYVTDQEYEEFLTYAGGRSLYLIPFSEFAYLCRLRVSEVCDLKRSDILPDGLFAARRKGSKDALTEWTPRLHRAVDSALALHEKIASLWLIPSATHGRMSESTIQTAWQRAMVEWALRGNARFTLHDLKRKGVSDAKGDKLAASGHRSAAMLRIYDVLPAKSPATR